MSTIPLQNKATLRPLLHHFLHSKNKKLKLETLALAQHMILVLTAKEMQCSATPLYWSTLNELEEILLKILLEILLEIQLETLLEILPTRSK